MKLLAPNGNQSNLAPEQYKLVRTPEFKHWFGDWENDIHNSSKILDENGEPLICFHGSNDKFDTFEYKNIGSAHDKGYYGFGFYFTFQTESKWMKFAINEAEYYGKYVKPYFIRAINPFIFSQLSMYKGVEISYTGTESLVFLSNIAERYPNLAEKITIAKKTYNRATNEYDISYVPISILPELIKKYANDLQTYETERGGRFNEKVIGGYLKSKTKEVFYDYTESGGKKGSYIDFDSLGDVQKGLSKEEIEILLIDKAIEKYDGIEADYHPEGYMTRYPEITEEIKKNHDCIMTNKTGDELVVFDNKNIKIADGTNTTFNPNSENTTLKNGGKIKKPTIIKKADKSYCKIKNKLYSNLNNLYTNKIYPFVKIGEDSVIVNNTQKFSLEDFILFYDVVKDNIIYDIIIRDVEGKVRARSNYDFLTINEAIDEVKNLQKRFSNDENLDFYIAEYTISKDGRWNKLLREELVDRLYKNGGKIKKPKEKYCILKESINWYDGKIEKFAFGTIYIFERNGENIRVGDRANFRLKDFNELFDVIEDNIVYDIIKRSVDSGNEYREGYSFVYINEAINEVKKLHKNYGEEYDFYIAKYTISPNGKWTNLISQELVDRLYKNGGNIKKPSVLSKKENNETWCLCKKSLLGYEKNRIYSYSMDGEQFSVLDKLINLTTKFNLVDFNEFFEKLEDNLFYKTILHNIEEDNYLKNVEAFAKKEDALERIKEYHKFTTENIDLYLITYSVYDYPQEYKRELIDRLYKSGGKIKKPSDKNKKQNKTTFCLCKHTLYEEGRNLFREGVIYEYIISPDVDTILVIDYESKNSETVSKDLFEHYFDILNDNILYRLYIENIETSIGIVSGEYSQKKHAINYILKEQKYYDDRFELYVETYKVLLPDELEFIEKEQIDRFYKSGGRIKKPKKNVKPEYNYCLSKIGEIHTSQKLYRYTVRDGIYFVEDMHNRFIIRQYLKEEFEKNYDIIEKNTVYRIRTYNLENDLWYEYGDDFVKKEEAIKKIIELQKNESDNIDFYITPYKITKSGWVRNKSELVDIDRLYKSGGRIKKPKSLKNNKVKWCVSKKDDIHFDKGSYYIYKMLPNYYEVIPQGGIARYYDKESFNKNFDIAENNLIYTIEAYDLEKKQYVFFKGYSNYVNKQDAIKDVSELQKKTSDNIDFYIGTYQMWLYGREELLGREIIDRLYQKGGEIKKPKSDEELNKKSPIFCLCKENLHDGFYENQIYIVFIKGDVIYVKDRVNEWTHFDKKSFYDYFDILVDSKYYRIRIVNLETNIQSDIEYYSKKQDAINRILKMHKINDEKYNFHVLTFNIDGDLRQIKHIYLSQDELVDRIYKDGGEMKKEKDDYTMCLRNSEAISGFHGRIYQYIEQEGYYTVYEGRTEISMSAESFFHQFETLKNNLIYVVTLYNVEEQYYEEYGDGETIFSNKEDAIKKIRDLQKVVSEKFDFYITTIHINEKLKREEIKNELIDRIYNNGGETMKKTIKSPKYEKGGKADGYQKETYEKWKDLVNMSSSELKKFMDSQEGKEAGLSKKQADKLGIHYGRESAGWIIKMKDTNVKDWTPNMWDWAKRQISFISRMRGNKGKLYDEKGNKTRKHTSLLIWGHNPEKYADGGSVSYMNDMNLISINLAEKMLGREINLWNDGTISISGMSYKKKYLSPFYEKIS